MMEQTITAAQNQSITLTSKWPFGDGQPICQICSHLGLDDEIRTTNRYQDLILASHWQSIHDLEHECTGCAVICRILSLYGVETGGFSRFGFLNWKSIVVLALVCDGIPLQFEIFADVASKSPLSSVQEISGNTGSPKALTWIKKQLLDCTNFPEHEACRRSGSPRLPRRILDISNLTQVRLREPIENERADYVCLSYCWGGTPPIMTTKSTVETYKRLIPWQDLPKLFQQAMATVYNLGLRYLWIDSLCIIQDDINDWRNEGSRMAQIYENAYITISALSAQNPSEGLFSEALSEYRCRTMSFQDSGSHILVRKLLYRTHLETQSLMKRGWTFQEMILSPRVLHFTYDELVWECMSTTTCECSGVGKGLNMFYNKQYLLGPRSLPAWKSYGKMWHYLVTKYTARALTYEKDIFPALQGLAHNLEKTRKCAYYAGLWEDTLIEDLLWTNPGMSKRRPKEWRAPTWSWASVLGGVSWNDTVLDLRILAQATAITKGKGLDCFGELKSGTLKLTARCFEATLLPQCYGNHSFQIDDNLVQIDANRGDEYNRPRSLASICNSIAVKAIHYVPDYDHTLAGVEYGSENATVQLALLAIGTEQREMQNGDLFVLVLRCSNAPREVLRDDLVYERIAYARVELLKDCEFPLGPFQGAEERTLTVI